MRFRAHCTLALYALLALGLLVAPTARATDIPLAFGSLPSAQGWAFTSGGIVTTEAASFSLSGNTLVMDTMGEPLAGSGTSAFYQQPGVVLSNQSIVIQLRARVTNFEGNFSNQFVGGGFAFGFAQGTTDWQMGITPTQIRNVNGAILSTAYDNAQFHDYRLEWDPPSTVRYYVDDTLISSAAGGLSAALNRIHLGDVTGASNARAEITQFRFLQGAATPAGATSWGRIKSLYR
jgi:hypothetical protein